jgi:hypothetical protein
MERAHQMDFAWIAGSLRYTLDELHQKNPVVIGAPSYFAALSRTGFVELPAEFPPLPLDVESESTAVHRVTPIKEVALAGAGRFFVGSVTTPKAGGPDTVGNNDGGTGAQSGKRSVLAFSLVPVWNANVAQITNPVTISGTGSSIANPQNAVDSDPSTFATLTTNGNSTTNQTQLACSQAPGIGILTVGSVVMNITREVVTNSITGLSQIVYELSYTTNGGASFTVLETLNSSAGTLAKGTISVNIPLPVNLSLCWFFIATSVTNNATGGTIVAKIYEANITVTE